MEGFRRKRLFFHEKRHSVWAKILFTVAISSCIILLTCHGLNRLMADSKEEEKRSLEEDLQREIVQCYVLEGHYPDSLSYLEEQYGFSYDKEQFFVDYQLLGANIMPDVTVIERKN